MTHQAGIPDLRSPMIFIDKNGCKRTRLSPLERLMLRTQKSDAVNGCWLWTGATGATGYGQMHLFGQTVEVHRVAYQALVGHIPEGMHLDHLCRVRNCVNPDHLEPVPPLVNWQRGESPTARYARRTTCGQGHEYTPENTYMFGTKRSCRKCSAAWQRAYTARKKAGHE